MQMNIICFNHPEGFNSNSILPCHHGPTLHRHPQNPSYQLATTLNSVSGGSKTFNGMAFPSFVVFAGGWLKGIVVKDSQIYHDVHESTMLFFGFKTLEIIKCCWNNNIQIHNVHVEDCCVFFVAKLEALNL